MSTKDVSGYRDAKDDELRMGIWADHSDGSLILVEANEGGRVIYSIFDMSSKPPIEYRDSMKTGAFQKEFSYDGKAGDQGWSWHDKTEFPWDRVIKAGVRDGTRHVHAEETIAEADRIRESRARFRDNAAQKARRAAEINDGHEVDTDELERRMERVMGKAGRQIVTSIQETLKKLKPGKSK